MVMALLLVHSLSVLTHQRVSWSSVSKREINEHTGLNKYTVTVKCSSFNQSDELFFSNNELLEYKICSKCGKCRSNCLFITKSRSFEAKIIINAKASRK